MDVYSGTGTQILDLPDDSEETVSGPTDRDDDSDADMAGPTDIDDDDNDDHGDGQSPTHGPLIVDISDIPCDPPVTQEDETRLDEGELVENLDMTMCEGGEKENGEGQTGDKNKDETPI